MVLSEKMSNVAKFCVNRGLCPLQRSSRLKFTALVKMRVEGTPLSFLTTDRSSFSVSVLNCIELFNLHIMMTQNSLVFLVIQGTADITGDLKLKEGTEMVMPGDNTTLDVELITPVPIEPGLRFNMREGGRTVGTGIVTKVLG